MLEMTRASQELKVVMYAAYPAVIGAVAGDYAAVESVDILATVLVVANAAVVVVVAAIDTTDTTSRP